MTTPLPLSSLHLPNTIPSILPLMDRLCKDGARYACNGPALLQSRPGSRAPDPLRLASEQYPRDKVPTPVRT
jgi:hypothetical protein